jgi:hypothetical protein
MVEKVLEENRQILLLSPKRVQPKQNNILSSRRVELAPLDHRIDQ